VAVTTPIGVQTGLIDIPFILTDPDPGDVGNLSIIIEWSTDGITWLPCTMGTGSDGDSGLSPGISYTYVWDSKDIKDFPDQWSDTMRVRITPMDKAGPPGGTPDTTGLFTVDNKGPVMSLPTVNTVTDTEVTVTWTVDEQATPTVWYGEYGDGTIADCDTEVSGSQGNPGQSVTLSGLMPGRNYTFMINSSDTIGNKATAGPYSFETEIWIQLYTGWNMISLPPILTDSLVADVLASIDGDYDIVQWYDASDSDDPWKNYIVGKGFGNDLIEIRSDMGIWIHMTAPGTLKPNHFDPSPITPPWPGVLIQMYEGWNFVGYTSIVTRTVADALSSISYDQVMTYDAATDTWWDSDSGSLTDMEMGRGYWIHCPPFPGTLSINYV
jgi:hypothetical protein